LFFLVIISPLEWSYYWCQSKFRAITGNCFSFYYYNFSSLTDMKKALLVASLFAALVACGKKEETTAPADAAATPTAEMAPVAPATEATPAAPVAADAAMPAADAAATTAPAADAKAMPADAKAMPADAKAMPAEKK
jgi:hypothetical protein